MSARDLAVTSPNGGIEYVGRIARPTTLVSAHSAAAMRNGQSGWRALPRASQLYVAVVTVAGAVFIALSLPSAWHHPVAFIALLVLSCLTSLWKVTLLPAKSESTLSVSYAADLMALLLLGPGAATIVAVAGAWTQCTFKVKQRPPLHRTIFSMAAEAITLRATGLAYAALGGSSHVLSFSTLPKPVVGAICAYFLVNTVLVAGAIALSARQPLWKVWHDNFLWSAPSFMVAGSAGAFAALVVERGEYWLAILLFAPVYLSYRTYRVFLGRIEDQQLHVEEARKLHAEALDALSLARRAERALAEETERLSVTLRSIADGVITTDMQGSVQLLNRAAEGLTGWTQQQAVGKPLAQIFHSVDRETCAPCDPLTEFLRSPDRPGLPRCSVLAARDRTERPIEVTAAPLYDASGRTIGMALVFRDMTDAIRMQAERARADKLASLGLLAGGIAHDFNDILMAIMGNVSLARATLPAKGQAATALDEAERACVRARHLTWQLLTFSKGGAPVKKTVMLPRLLEESAHLALSGTNAEYELDLEDDLCTVEADETQLVQVFNNVLRNAQQAMPHGGTITICAENVVERTHRCEYALQACPGRYVRISIADQGIGIPQENLGSIFDPYFTTKQSGSGLGLATSHSIIKNHAGFVTVDSTLGHGTTVHIHLPASVEADIVEDVGVVDWGTFRSGRILIMDDDPSSRALAVSMLEFLGYQPEAVSSGTAAVERYRDALANGCPFDAVILDLVVPEGTGGKETMERLGHMDGNVTAILASGYVHASVAAEFQKLGFKAIVPKPYTIDELSRTLDSVISTQTSRVH
jgi:PAS domain S-box-containing protein